MKGRFPPKMQGYDLIVAADGVNSTVRGWHDFGTTVSRLENKFAWYGTTKVFDTLTQTFVENEHGTFNAHHYRHSSRDEHLRRRVRSATWQRAGFAAMGEAETLAYLRKGIRGNMGGHRLVSNNRCGATSRTCATSAGRSETRC